jgi:hypothetical protein
MFASAVAFFVTFRARRCFQGNIPLNTMKTLLVIASLAAVAALVSLSTAALGGSLFFATGLAAIFASDYRRVIKPLVPRAALVAFPRTAQACEQAA